MKVALDFKDGYKLVRLQTPEEYDEEGNKMRHCVNKNLVRVMRVFSLRDARNEPHCTIVRNGDVQGKATPDYVSPKYRKYVLASLRHISYRMEMLKIEL